jgi:hypothetical protein
MSNFQKDDGTGMTPPPAAGSASGAVTSREATRKYPKLKRQDQRRSKYILDMAP